MGQQLQNKLLVFQPKRENHFDSADWPYSVLLYLLPLFYFLEENQALVKGVSQDDRCALHPYFQIKAQRLAADYQADEAIDLEDDSDVDLPLADRDIDWAEYDRLEEQFDLESETKADGFVIITLPGSIFALAPWDAPDENEETMLEGFDFETIDVPRVPIPCSYSRRS